MQDGGSKAFGGGGLRGFATEQIGKGPWLKEIGG